MGCPSEYLLVGIRAFCSACFIHALTHMALQLARGGKGLHVSLIRLWQSWAISMTVFQTFDFSEIRVFDWRVGSRGDFFRAAKNETIFEDSDLKDQFFPWPDWFQDVARYLYGFEALKIDPVTPTKVAECIAVAMSGPRASIDRKYFLLLSYHMLYPVLVLLMMIIMDLILIWVIYPSLQSMDFFHPTDPEEYNTWLFEHSKPTLLRAMFSEEFGTAEEHRDLVVQFFREILAKCKFSSMADVELIMEHPRQGLTALSYLFQDDIKEENREILTAVDLGKAKMAMALLSRQRIVMDLDLLLSTAETRKLYLWQTADKLDGLTAEQMLDSYELWEGLIHCAKHLSLEEWLSLCKSSQPMIDQLLRGSINPMRLQVAFIRPIFHITALEDHNMGPELSAKVWVSMRDALCELGPERIQDLLDHQKPLNKLLHAVEQAIPGSGSFLIVGLHEEVIRGHLRQIAPQRAAELWALLLDIMLFREGDTEAEDAPPKVRIKAAELTAEFNAGVDSAMLCIARKAGTGPGGYLLGKLHQGKIRQHLENLPGVYSKKTALSASEVQREVAKILEFCRRTDIDEIEQFLLTDNVAPLLEVCTRREAQRETDGRARQVSREIKESPPVAAFTGILPATKFGGLSSSGLGSFDVSMAESVTGMVETLKHQGKDVNYPVFGLFRDTPGIKNFLTDFTPLFWVALYVLWYETSKNLFLVMQCEGNIEDRSIQVWAIDSDQACYEGTHLIVAIIAMCGLAFWSTLSLWVLVSIIFLRKIAIQHEPKVARRYAYFVFGYKIDYIYWDILIKKTDNWITLVITYTGMAPDVRPKVFLCLILAMAAMIVHNIVQPFDDRKNMLCHRLENLGLLLRLVSFASLELFIIFGKWLNLWLCTLLATFTSGLYLYFNMFLWTNVLCELFASLVHEDQEGGEVDPERLEGLRALSKKYKSTQGVVRAERLLLKAMKCSYNMCLSRIVSVVSSTINGLANVQNKLESEVLGLMPGPNSTRRLHTNMSRIDGTFRKIFHRCKILHFHKGNRTQRKYIADVLGKFVAHLIVECEEERLEFGNGLLGRFLTIATTYKDLQRLHRVAGFTAADLAEIVATHLRSAAQASHDFIKETESEHLEDFNFFDKRKSAEKEYAAEELQRHRLTGEDINDTLMFLQKLNSDQINMLLLEAAKVTAEIGREPVPLKPLKKPIEEPAVKPMATRALLKARTVSYSKSMTSASSGMTGSKSIALVRQTSETASADSQEGTENTAADDPAGAWKKRAMELVNLPDAAGNSGKIAEVGANESLGASSTQFGQPSAAPSQDASAPHLKAWV